MRTIEKVLLPKCIGHNFSVRISNVIEMDVFLILFLIMAILSCVQQPQEHFWAQACYQIWEYSTKVDIMHFL